MKKLLYWIIFIIFVFVLGFGIITHIRYNNLEQNYNELLLKKSNVIDSLTNDNIKKTESIIELQSKINVLDKKIDSLYYKKSEIKQSKSNFTISSSISEGAELLKRNLNEKNINDNNL